MKIIFLDIDGVLNSYKNESNIDIPGYGACDFYNHECVSNLNKIIEKTDAKIVVSSSWRILSTAEVLQDKLSKMGCIGEVIGVTDDLPCPHCCRGSEIFKWIKDNEELVGPLQEYKSYVILDDYSDMLYWQRHNFVNTNGILGLSKEDAETAIGILSR